MRYAFNGYVLDATLRELRCEQGVVPCEPQVFDLIHHLIRCRDRIVSRDELLDEVWEGRVVSESAFRSRINAARRVLGDDGEAQRIIRTLSRRGYRFVAPVQECDDAGAPPGAVAEEFRSGQQAGAASQAPPQTVLPPAGKPVLAVLPFAELSGEEGREHVADGITSDIITALARHRSFLVVARNSAFAFRGHAGDIRDVGRDLGAHYLVEGTVRVLPDSLRVSAHLVDAASGAVLWADAFAGEPETLFEVQGSIIAAVAAAIELQIGSAERLRVEHKPPSSFRAWDLLQLGIKHLHKATAADNAEAQRLMRLAIEHDPGLAQAYAQLAYAILLSMLYFDADPDDERLAEAHALARRALDLDEQDAMSRFVLGRALLARRHYLDALEELRASADMNPALPISHCGIADSLAYEGLYEESFPHFQRAIEISRYDPQRWAFLSYRALAHLFARQFQLAYEWANRATRVPNCHYWPYAHRVAALGHLNREDELHEALAELAERRPGFTVEEAGRRLFYIKRQDQLDRYLAGLRRAGLPES